MKAEQRKALVTNSLANELGKVVEGIKHGPSRSTWVYLGVLALVVGGIFTFRYFLRSSEEDAAKRWLAFDGIVFPEQLDSFLNDEELKDTPQARFARFKEARHKLGQGLRDLGSIPIRAHDDIRAATALYEELAKTSDRVDLLTQEALWGAAKGNESLDEIEKAKEYYGRLAKEFPASALGKDAEKQLQRLVEDKRDLSELAKALAPPKK